MCCGGGAVGRRGIWGLRLWVSRLACRERAVGRGHTVRVELQDVDIAIGVCYRYKELFTVR
jgi:hypothetical protein